MKKKAVQIIVLILAVIVTVATVILLIQNQKQKAILAQQLKEQQIAEQRETVLLQADFMAKQYNYDEALRILAVDEEVMDERIQQKITEVEAIKSQLVEYKGTIEHIFFHSLIIYPELTFDNIGHDANGYNMWMTTVKEVKAMLPLLYESGYVLFGLNDVFGKNEEGKMIKKPIYLPEGKKPLIISQDDVNYYDYMKPDGFADKLVIDDEGNVSTLVITLEKETIVTRDGDLVPILDDFVKEHPDFSYRGAKGTLAITGYEGALGYRLETDEEIQQAKAVADRLKETGWELASHSFTHKGDGYFQKNITLENLKYDVAAWQNNIATVIGDTNIFISPFGVELKGENLRVILDEGKFDIYCTVGRTGGLKIKDDHVMMNRFNMDGFAMFNDRPRVESRFFPVDAVIDSARPPLKN